MFCFHVGIRPWFNPTRLYLPPHVSLWQTQAQNSSSGLNKAREARFQDTSARQIADDGGETVSKSVNKTTQLLKIKRCILIMSLITILPPPLLPPFSSPQALWRDKSPPRHSCTMESIDDPLTDSQKPSCNTTNTTLPTPPPTSQQLHPNPGPAKAGSNTSSYSTAPHGGSKVQQQHPKVYPNV